MLHSWRGLVPAVQTFYQLKTFGASWNSKYDREDPGQTRMRPHSFETSVYRLVNMAVSQLFKTCCWNQIHDNMIFLLNSKISDFKHLIGFTCSFASKTLVYEICKSLHSVFLTFYKASQLFRNWCSTFMTKMS